MIIKIKPHTIEAFRNDKVMLFNVESFSMKELDSTSYDIYKYIKKLNECADYKLYEKFSKNEIEKNHVKRFIDLLVKEDFVEYERV